MKITAVRYRRLESKRDGSYGHTAFEAEAAVEEGEDPVAAANELEQWVHNRLADTAGADFLRKSSAVLQGEVRDLERQRNGLREECGRLKPIVLSSERLVALAKAAGLTEVADLLDDDGIPF